MQRQTLSLLTSGVLVVLVLSVFAAAQSAGPESVIRRWLRALEMRDANTAQTLLVAPLQSEAGQWLVQFSSELADRPMRVVAKERVGERVLVVTNHSVSVTVIGSPTPQPMTVTRYWVLSRSNGQWRIDPVGTFRYVNQSRFFRP